MAKTRLNLLKIVREWEHYNREKELSLYINGEAAEWLSVYQEKLSPLKWQCLNTHYTKRLQLYYVL